MRKINCPHCNGTGSMEIPNGSIGSVLKFIRGSKNLSLREVEKGTGISNSYLSRIETGRVESPSFSHIKILCEYYGISIDSLPLPPNRNRIPKLPALPDFIG
jgi:transcriptional regulator with XRE-family HTH domain